MDEDTEYTTKMALADAQEHAEKGLKALERAHFHLDAHGPDELFEALQDVYRALTAITRL